MEWQSATSGDSISLKDGSELGLTKKVNPESPAPGQKVTNTVDLVNTGADADNISLTDTLSADLRAGNPSGYGNLTCRALTSVDQVFPAGEQVAAAQCPTFTSEANGISADGFALPRFSGLCPTYTAIAPLTSTSSTNRVIVRQDSAYVANGDADSQVNIYVQAISLSGTVWHDADGSANGFDTIRTASEVGTDASGLVAGVDHCRPVRARRVSGESGRDLSVHRPDEPRPAGAPHPGRQ